MSVIGELMLRIGVDPSSWSDLQSTIASGKQDVSDFGDAVTSVGQAMDSSFAGSVSSVTSSLSDLGDAIDPVKAAQDALRQAFADTGVSMDTLDNSSSALADALNEMGIDADAVRDPVQAVGDAASSAGDSVSSLGDAAGSAAPQVQEVGDSAESAEGGLSDMVEQLKAMGEALVITEGLKEFGQEALSAASTVQSVTVGLTALTGSATEADAIIEDIKNLAATQPFAFPDIAPTVQKMVAMGVAASAIPGVLQSIADTAAATTNSFDAVANMFDRMTISGVANARSLATLGISAEALNTAMGTLGAGADATTKQISAAFAALPDQATRVTVLEAALSKFAGTSIAEAQTIGGQWQIFQNNFEEVMVGVGDALTPVVGELLSFGEVILSAVGGAVKEFNDLPEPVKEVTVAFGLLTASLVPITGALAAMAFAADGLTKLQGLATALGNSFSGATKEVTVADTAVTEFTELSGPLANVAQVVGVTEQSIDELGKTSLETAAQVSDVAEGASKFAEGIKGLGTAEEVEAAVATTSAEAHTTAADAFLAETAASTEGAAAQELLATATTATTATTVAGGAAATEAATAIGSVGTVAVVAEGAVALLGIAIAAVDFKELASTANDAYVSLKELFAVGTDLPDIFTELSIALSSASSGSGTLATAAKGLSGAWTGATSDILMEVIPGMSQMNSILKGIGATADVVGTQISKLTGKWPPLTAALQNNLTALENTNQKLSEVGINAISEGAALGGSVQKVIDSVTKQNAAVQQATAVFNTLNDAFKANKPLADGTVVTAQEVAAAHKVLASVISAATDTVKTHTTATGALKDSYDAINKDATALIATENAAQATFDRLSASQDGSIQKAIALGIAQANLEKAITAVSNAVGIQGTAESAVALATQAIYDKTTLANTALTTAQQVYHDVAVETNNGATNQAAYNLAVDALVAAYKAANPALVTAKGNIQDIAAAAIDAANKATGLATAHQNMVTIVKNGETTMVAVPAYLNAIGTAATNAVGPLTNLGTAHGNMATTVGAGHAPLLAAGTDISNLGKYATDAQTPVANLGTGVSHIVQIVGEGGGNSALQTVAETFGKMGTEAGGSVTPISDLGIKVEGLGVIVQDAEGKMQIFPQAIQNIGQAALNTGTDFSNSGDYIADWAVKAGLAKDTTDIFDTSMIKISGDTTSASDAMNQYGTTIVNSDGTITNLTDLLKSLATQWESVAASTNDATAAQNNYNSAASSAPSSGAGGSGKKSGKGALSYIDPTTPAGAAILQQEAAAAGPFAMGGTFSSASEQTANIAPTVGETSYGGLAPQAVKGPSLAGDNYPPVYGAGSGVAGTPMVLVSNDGGSTWTDAGYGDYPTGTGVSADAVGGQLDAMETNLQNAILKTGASVTSVTDAGAAFTAATQDIADAAAKAEAAVLAGVASIPTGSDLAIASAGTATGGVASTTFQPGQYPTSSTINPNIPTSANPETGVVGSSSYSWNATSQSWVPTGQTYAGTTNTPGGGGLPAQGANQIEEAAVLQAAGATNVAFTAAGNVIFTAATSAILTAVENALSAWNGAGAGGLGTGVANVLTTSANYGPQATPAITAAQLQALLYQSGTTPTNYGATPGAGTPLTVNIVNPQISSMQDANRFAGIMASGIRNITKL